ncbi:MAG: uroporphyrinogen decarboxylase [Clostridiales bacterium]|jgi:uroporphyrinogen-III decarboxylase|nr:uroporphyrinogen decarboxylase [Clostridiales bacterium]
MLTKRRNMLETIRGGKPDRFVNQFEALELIFGDPYMRRNMALEGPGSECVNSWGVTIRYQANTPGPFPVHDEAHKVVKDITRWRETVKAPSLDFPQEEWDAIKPMIDKIDRSEKFATAMVAPGVFEQLHYLMGMDDCLVNFYAEPEAMKELIEYITDWELEYARLICENYHPDALLHHDDWGSHRSSFMSPEMFEEFIVPSYKRIYGYYKSHGVELIIHHSDSYAANLVPYMIEMGIDVFQGCVDTNNVPELIKKYGGKISFMGGLNNGILDVHNWTEELIATHVEKVCRECGKLYFIPCLTAGGPGSTYPGVFEAVSKHVDRMSSLLF